jgi:hypothetical protein
MLLVNWGEISMLLRCYWMPRPLIELSLQYLSLPLRHSLVVCWDKTGDCPVFPSVVDSPLLHSFLLTLHGYFPCFSVFVLETS